MKHLWQWLTLLGLTVAIAGCGGGGGSAPAAPLSLQESQRYFPLTDGNVWVARVTDNVNGSTTASYTSVSQRVGTRLVGNVMASVMTNTNLPSATTRETYLVKDGAGVMAYGNNDPSDTLTAALVPYRMVSFPIQAGSGFQQVNRSGLDYGSDLDGDGRHERLDVVANVVVRGFEPVTVAAGTFQNCLRIETNVSETLTLSASGTRVTANGTETNWYAQDVGPVKQAMVISGSGQTAGTTGELDGYLVDGRAVRLGMQVPTPPSISAGTTTQVSVTLVDANNAPLITVPASWTTSDSAVATVDASGTVTGAGIGSATLTPWVGGVAGAPVPIRVLLGFSPAARYPLPANYSWAGNTAVGDLNGDGRNDVAVLESYGTRVLIYCQNSAGTLDPPQVVATGLILRGIAIGDVNHDGLADLVVSGNVTPSPPGWAGRLAVFSQNPATHGLNTTPIYVLSTNNAGPLALADLNGDGLTDVAVIGEGSGGNGLVSLFFQGGSGTLGPEVAYTSVPVMAGGEIHVADLNGDGRNDLVVQSGNKQLAVIKQLAPGVFSTTPDFCTVQTSYWSNFRSFALGDLNGDGRIDIAVADPGNSGYLNIFLQNAGGTLTGPTLLTSDVQDEVHVADLDGDGLNEIIILAFGNTVRVFNQAADHTFATPPLTFLLPTQSTGGTQVHQAMSVADVTGDGRPDLIASWMSEGVYVLPRR